MKITNKALLAAVFAACNLLSSCTLEPFEEPQIEKYTKGFVKRFGLIDPQQDWNMAQEGNVTVDVGEHADRVKVYVKVEGNYYLVANLIDLEGTVNIPIDIPEGCNDLCVKIDGRKYFTTNGGIVSKNAPQSRGISGSTYNSSNYTGNAAGTNPGIFSLSAEESGYSKFNSQQIAPITSKTVWNDYYTLNTAAGADPWRYNTKKVVGLMPEIDQSNDGTSKGNQEAYDPYHRAHINKDFFISPGENGQFRIQPVYWQTSGTHTLGVYPVDDNGNPLDKDGNAIVIPQNPTDAEINAIIANMVLMPFYTDKGNADIQTNAGGGTIGGGSGSGSGSGSGEGEGGSGTTTTVTHTKTEYYTIYPEAPDALVTAFNSAIYQDTSDNWSWKPVTDETTQNAFKTAVLSYFSGMTVSAQCPDCNWVWKDFTVFDAEIGAVYGQGNGTIKLTLQHSHTQSKPASRDDEPAPIPSELIENGAWTDAGWASPPYDVSKPVLCRSMTYTVTLNENSSPYTGKFGMYIYYANNGFFFSQSVLNKPLKCPAACTTCYAASYKHPMSDRVYFSFEDWKETSSDMDLNDLIFILSDVDKLVGTHEIVVNTDEDENFYEEGFTWLIAAEDLGSTDDFDFNDIVFALTSVTYNSTYTYKETTSEDGVVTNTVEETRTATTKRLTVKALAAGGTLPAYLHYYDGISKTDYILGPEKVVVNSVGLDCSDCEWHKWFGNYPHTTMINTGNGTRRVDNPKECVLGPETVTVTSTTVNGNTQTTTEVTGGWVIQAFENFKMAQYCRKLNNHMVNGFYITVNTSNPASIMEDISDATDRFIYAPGVAEAPQMFCIPDIGATTSPGGWEWPTERTDICEAYETFVNWVNNASNREWHKSPTGESVIRVKPNNQTSGSSN